MEESPVEIENPTAVIEDKVAAAREARRRRILENSSKRLEKITGRNAEEFEKGRTIVFRTTCILLVSDF